MKSSQSLRTYFVRYIFLFLLLFPTFFHNHQHQHHCYGMVNGFPTATAFLNTNSSFNQNQEQQNGIIQDESSSCLSTKVMDELDGLIERSKPSRIKDQMMIRFSCFLQRLLLQHRKRIPLSQFLLDIIYNWEVTIYTLQGAKKFLTDRSHLIGPNYCCIGRVIIGEYTEAAKIMANPKQIRGNYLGRAEMVPERLPADFLLFLSDTNPRHGILHSYLWNHFIPPAEKRVKNSSSIYKKFAQDLVHQVKTHCSKPWTEAKVKPYVQRMVIQYMSQSLFELSLTEEQIDMLQELFYTGSPTTNFVAYALKPFNFPNRFVTKVYENVHIFQQMILQSVALKNYIPSEINGFLSPEEYSYVLLGVVGIAGFGGGANLLCNIFAEIPSEHYINMNDSNELVLAILEAARIKSPVNNINIITQEPTEYVMGDNDNNNNNNIMFPAGTVVASSIGAAMLDPAEYPEPEEFDHLRSNLVSTTINFNDVGFVPTGVGRRTCPGRNVAIQMGVDLLVAIREDRAKDIRDIKVGGNDDDNDVVAPREFLKRKSISVDDLLISTSMLSSSGKNKVFRSDVGPRIGGMDLPKSMRGIFWITNQGNATSLLSFAKSNDGGGLGLGKLLSSSSSSTGRNPIAIQIRIAGDRQCAFASDGIGTKYRKARSVDLIYQYELIDGTIDEPTSFRIHPRVLDEKAYMNEDIRNGKIQWIMTLMDDDEDDVSLEFEGSHVWVRESIPRGKRKAMMKKRRKKRKNNKKKKKGGILKENQHYYVQIVDENGNPIQPAYDQWIQYMKSSMVGKTRGQIFYYEVDPKHIGSTGLK